METFFEDLKAEVISGIDFSRELSDTELFSKIDRVLVGEKLEYLSAIQRKKLRKEIFDSFRRLDVLQDLIEDEGITEIMVNGPSHIFYERGGKLFESERRFASREKLDNVVQQIVAEVNRSVNTACPIVDARLADGSRVNIAIPPVAPDGPIVTIRKFPKDRITMDYLITNESVSKEAAAFLIDMVRAGYNIFISGGTGSGKTTLLNALSDYIPENERVVTIEDSMELQLSSKNLVRLEARKATIDGEGEVSIRELIKTALRMRPNRLIVGEIRGKEALDMLQAMNTGHDGSLSTGHANSPKDMLSRIETMVLMGGELPLPAIRMQIASAIDIMVHVGRTKDGSRKILSIDEVVGYEKGQIRLQKIFEHNGKLEKVGEFKGR